MDKEAGMVELADTRDLKSQNTPVFAMVYDFKPHTPHWKFNQFSEELPGHFFYRCRSRFDKRGIIMRYLLCLLLLTNLLSAEGVRETFTTLDGRVITGVYDEKRNVVCLDGAAKLAFLRSSDIKSRVPAAPDPRSAEEIAQTRAEFLLATADSADCHATSMLVKIAGTKFRIAEVEGKIGKKTPQVIECLAKMKKDCLEYKKDSDEKRATAKANRAEAEKVLDAAHVPHEPIVGMTFPLVTRPYREMLALNLPYCARAMEYNPTRTDKLKQAEELLAAAADDEEYFQTVYVACEAVRLSPIEIPGYNDHPEWKRGTPEFAARDEWARELHNRLGYLRERIREKREMAKELKAEVAKEKALTDSSPQK